MNRREITATGTSTGVDPLVLTFEPNGPTTGFGWDLRRVTIVDADSPQTAHDATLFIVTPGRTAPDLEPSEIADTTPCGLPAVATYSRGTIELAPPEILQVWIYTLAAGVRVTAVAQVEEDRS